MNIKIVDFENDMINDFYKLVSANVVRIRKEKKISQLQLALAIGHGNATFLGKAELQAENKHFNLEHLYKIATVLDVKIEEFFKSID